MAKQSYRAIVRYAPNMAGKYREIMHVAAFIANMVRMYDAYFIQFYDNDTRAEVGYWKRGKTHAIHQPRGRQPRVRNKRNQ